MTTTINISSVAVNLRLRLLSRLSIIAWHTKYVDVSGVFWQNFTLIWSLDPDSVTAKMHVRIDGTPARMTANKRKRVVSDVNPLDPVNACRMISLQKIHSKVAHHKMSQNSEERRRLLDRSVKKSSPERERGVIRRGIERGEFLQNFYREDDFCRNTKKPMKCKFRMK